MEWAASAFMAPGGERSLLPIRRSARLDVGGQPLDLVIRQPRRKRALTLRAHDRGRKSMDRVVGETAR